MCETTNLQPATEGRPHEKIHHPSASIRPRLQVTNIAARVAVPHEISLTSEQKIASSTSTSMVPSNYCYQSSHWIAKVVIMHRKHRLEKQNLPGMTGLLKHSRFCSFVQKWLWYLWHTYFICGDSVTVKMDGYSTRAILPSQVTTQEWQKKLPSDGPFFNFPSRIPPETSHPILPEICWIQICKPEALNSFDLKTSHEASTWPPTKQ